jgi:hypothetical protein
MEINITEDGIKIRGCTDAELAQSILHLIRIWLHKMEEVNKVKDIKV